MADLNANDQSMEDASAPGSIDVDRQIPSTREHLTELEAELVAQIESVFGDDASSFAIRLALEEALTNAWRHGNQGDPNRSIIVRGRIEPRRIEFHVIDEGPGFDPDHVPDPTRAENLEIPSGRGLMLMRAYMTSIVHHPPGNHVELVLDRDAPAAEAE